MIVTVKDLLLMHICRVKNQKADRKIITISNKKHLPIMKITASRNLMILICQSTRIIAKTQILPHTVR